MPPASCLRFRFDLEGSRLEWRERGHQPHCARDRLPANASEHAFPSSLDSRGGRNDSGKLAQLCLPTHLPIAMVYVILPPR